MEPECSLPHSQQPATCPYPEPYQSSQQMKHISYTSEEHILPTSYKKFRCKNIRVYLRFRSALFRDITQRRVIIPCRRSGKRIGPIFKGQDPWILDR
jgi:hypothetical protein